MLRYTIKRLFASIGLLFLASILIFIVLRVIPGDPTLSILGGQHGMDPHAFAAIRHTLGIDRPLYVQYFRWIGGILHGDLGKSYFSQYPVATIMEERIGPTVELTVVSMVWATIFAVAGALVAALHPGSIWDRAVSATATVGIAAPPFLIGIILVLVLSVRFGVLPARGYASFTANPAKSLEYVLLPSLTLGLAAGAPILRFLRASLAEEMNAPYMRTAEGKGLPWRRAVTEHALPNALIPALTVAGLTVGYLLGGIVAVEYVFGWQGLGSLVVDSVQKRDYGVLQTAVLFAAAGFLLAMLAVDLLAGAIDPRLRIRGRETS